jgi:hypothetical protein
MAIPPVGRSTVRPVAARDRVIQAVPAVKTAILSTPER